MDKSFLASILYAQLNLFALAIMLVLIISVKIKKNKLLRDQRLFIAMVLNNALLLILDIAMFFLNGIQGQHIRVLISIVTVLYYVFTVLICALWYLYVNYYILRNKELLRKRIISISLPLVIVFILSIISVFREVVFFIDENNVYHRGKYFLIMAGACVFYVGIAYICIIIKRKLLHQREFRALLLFAVPTIIGGIIQVLVYGISLFWICATVSLLILYINIQNTLLYKDYLTELYNRRQYDNYIKDKINSKSKKSIIGIMIDIDSFKNINDECGHDNGDLALKYTAQVLRDTFGDKDFISRYGGDEFIVVLETENDQEPRVYIDAIKHNLEKMNDATKLPFVIGLSIGYGFHVKGETASDFFKKIDKMMYIDKKSKTNGCQGNQEKP